MAYVRISLMRPKTGHTSDVARIMLDLLSFYRTQTGYVDGFLLRSTDGDGEIGRVTIWRSEADTDATAQTAHVLSTRSRLMPLIEDESHVERSFEAEEAAPAKLQ